MAKDNKNLIDGTLSFTLLTAVLTAVFVKLTQHLTVLAVTTHNILFLGIAGLTGILGAISLTFLIIVPLITVIQCNLPERNNDENN